MKSLLFLFLFLSFSPLTKGQDSVNKIFKRINKEARFKIKDQDSCKIAIKNALTDIDNNSIKYNRYGNTGGWPVEFLTQEISKKYNISIDFPGCVSNIQMECYNKTVEPFILKKFSKSFDDIIEEEQFNYYTSIGRRYPSYPGGKQKLQLDLICLLKGSSVDYFSDIWLRINKEGNVNRVSGDTARFTQPELKIIKKAVSQLKFHPALKDYQAIDGSYLLRYSSYDVKNKNCK